MREIAFHRAMKHRLHAIYDDYYDFVQTYGYSKSVEKIMDAIDDAVILVEDEMIKLEDKGVKE